MKNKRIIAMIILAVAILLICFGCTAKNGVDGELQPLTVGIMPDLNSIPFVVAKQQGYLGENVTIELFRSAVDRDSALFSGNIDGTISDILAVALAQNGGFEAYSTSKTNGRYGIVAASSSGASSAKDLEGKEVAISLNTIIEYFTDMAVIHNGGDPSKVEKIAVPKMPARLELLENNKIDAIGAPEPFITAGEEAGGFVICTSDDISFNPSCMLFSGEAVNNKSKELADLYASYDKAVDYINNTEPSVFMPEVVKELGLPESALNVALPVYEKSSPLDKAAVEQAVEWLMEHGLIEKAFAYDDLVIEIK